MCVCVCMWNSLSVGTCAHTGTHPPLPPSRVAMCWLGRGDLQGGSQLSECVCVCACACACVCVCVRARACVCACVCVCVLCNINILRRCGVCVRVCVM
jgi:hypothetical protein